MDYSELTVEQRKSICVGRIAQYETDYFGNSLNLVALQALPDADPSKAQAIAQAQANLATLTSSIAAVRAVLESLTE